jgi:endonuclease/exonuclease/phosphatase family metal-dependent hydrolase
MRSGDSAQAIVLGDFNDEPRAATSQLLLGPPDADASKDDQLDFARLYSLVDSIPLRGDETKDKRFLTDTERFTRIYQGRRELIDHILVSKGLLGASADLRADRWKVQEVRSLVADIAGQEIGDNPAERVGERCPDHAPVYARFLL